MRTAIGKASLLLTAASLLATCSRNQPPILRAPADAGSGGAAEERGTLSPRLMRLHPEAREWVGRTLEEMSLRERVAQLVMPWISGAAVDRDSAELDQMLAWVEADAVGGLIVSRGAPAAVAAKLNAAQARARVPLLVVSDLETGPGMRLSPGGTDLPPAMAFGAADQESLAREAGRITGREARAVGIHLTLGPVLDVNSNPDNPIINVRSFGGDPGRVSRLAGEWVAGAREAGLLTAGKHFPGHGDTEVDSHVGLATISGDRVRLATVELVPFESTIAAGVDGLLVGHIAVTALEGPQALPASLSPAVVRDLLRERMGFDGLVFTDALNMGAITRNFSVEEASIRALLAGADVLLQPPGTSSVIAAIVRAVESGRVPRSRIDEAAQRVLVAKAGAGLHRARAVELDSVGSRVGTPEHAALAILVAERSITLVRDRGGLVPIRPTTRRVLHVSYGSSGETRSTSILNGELASAGLQVEHVPVSARTSRDEFEALRQRAVWADLVIASAEAAPHQYRALGLQGGFAAFVAGLPALHVPVVALSLGSPYLLNSFPAVPAYLLAWSASAASQRAAARALLGLAPITGKLPVPLPPHHEAGEGVERSGFDH